MTQLCVAIFVNDAAQARRDLAIAGESGADIVELRIDRLITGEEGDGSKVGMVRQLAETRCIVTCRAEWEGGECSVSDTKRLLTLSVAASGAEFVDAELASDEKALAILVHYCHKKGTRVIFSSHDVHGRPDKLNNILVRLNDSPADIAKIVWTARTIRDNLEAFEILQNRQKPTIALCMGEAGLISRVLAKKFGAFLTFASLDGIAGTAPGQISISDMKNLYRWDAIQADTKVYGVVGYPVAHSMSPAIHNAAFEHAKHNGVYLPLLVNPGYESFKAFMESFVPFNGLHLSGLSITIPHKENALRYLKEKGAEVQPLADQIGAVNTIVIDGQNLRGFNTDYAAIFDSITACLGVTREQLRDYRVAVIGAGGTGRTAVAALAACGATVVIYNRTREKADALAAEFNGKTGKVVAAAMEKLADSCCQIFINTTSIGMHPDVDQSPMIDASVFGPDTLVFDVVYNPMRTKLIQMAEAAGAKTVGGIEMFVRQAGGQFSAWTQKDPPLDLMRRVVEQRLSTR